MALYRKHQKVKKQDTDGLLHHNRVLTHTLRAFLVQSNKTSTSSAQCLGDTMDKVWGGVSAPQFSKWRG